MVCSARGLVLPGHRSDPVAMGAYQLEHWVAAMDRALAGRAQVGEDRFLDVYHQDFERSPIATVEEIYAFLGLDLTARARAAMAEWCEANRRGARGAHQYSVEDFGQTEVAVRRAFSRYTDRFGRAAV